MERHTCTREGRRDFSDRLPILLVAPTRAEYAVVRASDAGQLADQVELTACGVGPAAVSALCRRLDARTALPRILVLVGYAGGLDPALAPGDLVVAEAALNARGERIPCGVLDVPGARVGPLLSVAEPLCTPEEKRAAWRCGAIAVEMEAYPLAAWAQARGVPFVHARVILDTADESLPELGDAFGVMGEVHWSHLARAMLARPGLGLALLRIAHRAYRVRPALSTLARVVVQAC